MLTQRAKPIEYDNIRVCNVCGTDQLDSYDASKSMEVKKGYTDLTSDYDICGNCLATKLQINP